jgi:pimeloyl-ACP methyl ester carboxylesterase
MDDTPARVRQEVLDDLRRRLLSTRRIHHPMAAGWMRGVDTGYVYDLLTHWVDSYDWRVAERRIRGLPWQLVSTGGRSCRALHQRSARGRPAVVLLHGWPDSVLRFERVLPLLSDLNVVVPALPGFPFASALDGPDSSTPEMGALVADVMFQLGYDRYVVSGGDVGAWVAHAMAAAAPDSVAALHLTDVPYEYLFTVADQELTPDEVAAKARAQRWRDAEGAYDALQTTKPDTLAVALGDSPAGLLAWIVEKLHGWSDCGGVVETVFARDDLLTWVTAYWVTDSIATSFAPYSQEPIAPAVTSVPTVVTAFPKDIPSAPESLARRFFDVRTWERAPRGGHFAAWEAPDLFTSGVRAAVALAERTSETQ